MQADALLHICLLHPAHAPTRTAILPAARPAPPRPLLCRTLAELNLPQACREVVDKGADAVLDEIETAILMVAASVLRGEGFTYTLPNRSRGNQLYVPGGRAACSRPGGDWSRRVRDWLGMSRERQ